MITKAFLLCIIKKPHMSTEATKIKISEKGTEVTYQFLANLEELKKCGQLTKWVDDHDICFMNMKGKLKQ